MVIDGIDRSDTEGVARVEDNAKQLRFAEIGKRVSNAERADVVDVEAE